MSVFSVLWSSAEPTFSHAFRNFVPATAVPMTRSLCNWMSLEQFGVWDLRNFHGDTTAFSDNGQSSIWTLGLVVYWGQIMSLEGPNSSLCDDSNLQAGSVSIETILVNPCQPEKWLNFRIPWSQISGCTENQMFEDTEGCMSQWGLWRRAHCRNALMQRALNNNTRLADSIESLRK